MDANQPFYLFQDKGEFGFSLKLFDNYVNEVPDNSVFTLPDVCLQNKVRHSSRGLYERNSINSGKAFESRLLTKRF